jgi:outer membrane protein assembly factor BamB
VKAASALFLLCFAAQAQERDWSFYGGDAQRTGWEKSDLRITKENVHALQLVLKHKFDIKQKGQYTLTPPVVIGRLISYRGFKELAFVAGSNGDLWSVDADMDRIFWQKHFEAPKTSAACSGVTAIPSLTPPMNFAARGQRSSGGLRILTNTGFGAARPAFHVSADGKLHLLNTSNGDDVIPPMNFLPAGAKASSLTVHDGVVYTTTIAGCGSAPNGVWAIDLSGDSQTPPPVATFSLDSAAPPRLGGLALGMDGTAYVQAGAQLFALTPKDLKPKQSFTAPETSPAATPVIFTYKERDLVVSAGKDGRLYLFDSQSLATPLHQTPPIASGATVWGGLSSWQDAAGARYIAAPIWSPGGEGSMAAYKLEDHEGKPILTPAWSHAMPSPEPPVITSGIVFALSAGGKQAVLYALDAETGKELWSSGSQVTAPANLTGLSLANGRVYFTTTDDTLYAFGIFFER